MPGEGEDAHHQNAAHQVRKCPLSRTDIRSFHNRRSLTSNVLTGSTTCSRLDTLLATSQMRKWALAGEYVKGGNTRRTLCPSKPLQCFTTWSLSKVSTAICFTTGTSRHMGKSSRPTLSQSGFRSKSSVPSVHGSSLRIATVSKLCQRLLKNSLTQER
jgi:hypothetical protein